MVTLPIFLSIIAVIIWAVRRNPQVRRAHTNTDRREMLIAWIMPCLLIMNLVLLASTESIVRTMARKIMPADAPYRYTTDAAQMYLLQSTGPDADYDLTEESPEIQSLLAGNYIGALLPPYEYDPTNGTFSNGDVFRLGP